MQYRHIILDRDGVLNHEAAELPCVRTAAQFHWLPGALEGLAILRCAGVYVSVATNQSAVGRGLMTLEQLQAVHEYMRAAAAREGGALDAVLVCHHTPEAQCNCRKPAAGLIQAAMTLAGIAATATLVVGDDRRDLEAASRAGVAAALVRTGKGRQTEELLRGCGVAAYDDLKQLARAIVAGSRIQHVHT
ncbi:MAG TPA: HAD-IIIA family hydrolase [Steroidobacteraceae bacterium]|nr:HAD-IIIA family hydrolase [Steroidobacteraceae bacterium]